MNVDDIYGDLAELRERLPLVGEMLEPGTPRRWSQRDLTADQRAQMDAQALSERAARLTLDRQGIVVVGETRAPLRVPVLDQLVAVDMGVREIEECVCEWLGLTPLTAPTTRQRIDRIVSLLDRIAALDELAAWVASEAARLNRLARRACGDAEPVHRLDARCPVCNSMSLRAFPERSKVVCVNAACQCIDEGCGCHRDPPRRHTWLFGGDGRNSWTWLAQQLDQELEAAS